MARRPTTAEKTQTPEMEVAKPAPTDNLPAPRARAAINPIVPANWQEIANIAAAICRAGMAPKSYLDKEGNPVAEKVAIAIMHGMEVGMTPMASLQSLAVINGMPSLYGDGMLAVVRASGLLEDIVEEEEEWDKFGPIAAICRVKRKGETTWGVQRVCRDDAIKAGWWDKAGPWKLTPHRMLQMRARGWALRDKFADVLRGLHSAEEMEDLVDVTPRGSASTGAPEPQRQDYTAAAQTKNETPASTPPRDQSAGQGQAGGKDAPAGGDKAKGSPAQPGPKKTPAKEKPVTDVVDQNEKAAEQYNPHGFPPFLSPGQWYEFSDTFLQSATTTPAMARAWEAFYREKIAELASHEKEAVRNEINDTLGLLTAKLREEDEAPREREPDEEG